MMKKILKQTLMVTALLAVNGYAVADVVQNYKCTQNAGMRGPMGVTNVGLGVFDSNSDDSSILFCDDRDMKSCWASDNYIDTARGKADYTTLLTAMTSGLKVSFYCEPGGYAKNIHLWRTN